jgi:hypothetical protein
MTLWALASLVGQEVAKQSTPFDYLAPILSTGIVGVMFLMVLFRIKIMPTYVHEDAKKEWERERTDKDATIAELKRSVTDANKVYTEQVIPTLTRILDNEQELVAIRRSEQQRRERVNGDAF